MRAATFGKELRIGDISVMLPYDVREVHFHEGIFIVLMDPDSMIELKSHPVAEGTQTLVSNLIGVDPSGRIRWQAEYPQAEDYYYRLVSVDPLVASSFSSFRCTINAATGLIVQREFVK